MRTQPRALGPAFSASNFRRRHEQAGAAGRSGTVIRALSSVMILVGLLALLDGGLTLVWQEPVTALIALVRQNSLDRSYLSLGGLHLSQSERRALEASGQTGEKLALLARREEREVPYGAAIGRIEIPRIGASFYVVQGTDSDALQEGPGHYAQTAMPGEGGTIAIAGHRTTFLAPFRRLNELRPGNRIVLSMPYGTFTYAVQDLRVVSPNAWWITRRTGYERLVLSACTPLFSATNRIVAFAKLVQEVPARALRAA